ncbi:type VII secretion protein EccB [Phytohabitans sp. ZYX-F-186]|uniref:Type VII secretion protein EccB n=1 Tax=Phytohabitans maris TaxID=3071409 RepID=A0ABU0ZJW3_9ACTN|nr:type VII secretion protein EccB [Phytohabitans sp. ZYX-F-186]MDQ7906560.1 type VII secretion protein EccB [Phytohabitans sp. ZYX-F-186]
MATRRDQLHSYQFLTQRVISAFVMRETDPQQSPLRRGVGAVFGGVMVAILVAAGFGIYGILTKVGSDGWKTEGAVVIEKETGASFVYVGGALHPTLNFASAKLAAGRPGAQVFRISSNSLGEVPRGNTIGIPGAPDSLPGFKKRIGLPWTICSAPGTDDAGTQITRVRLAVGRGTTGGHGLTDSEGLLVRDSGADTTYLIWRGRRHLVNDATNLVPAIFGEVRAARVGSAWINSLPAGNEIQTITIPDRGSPSSQVSGRTIGEVLTTETGSGEQHYLVFDDGVAAITPLQLAILGAAADLEREDVAVSVVNSAPKSARLRPPASDAGAAPESAPTLVPASEQVCAVTSDGRALPSLVVGGTVEGLDTVAPTASASGDGALLADGVLVPSGWVATVRVLASPTAEAGGYFVVTDTGIKYAVPSAEVLELLGYPAAEAIEVPTALMLRLPTGPTLNPSEAIKAAT